MSSRGAHTLGLSVTARKTTVAGGPGKPSHRPPCSVPAVRVDVDVVDRPGSTVILRDRGRSGRCRSDCRSTSREHVRQCERRRGMPRRIATVTEPTVTSLVAPLASRQRSLPFSAPHVPLVRLREEPERRMLGCPRRSAATRAFPRALIASDLNCPPPWILAGLIAVRHPTTGERPAGRAGLERPGGRQVVVGVVAERGERLGRRRRRARGLSRGGHGERHSRGTRASPSTSCAMLGSKYIGQG